MLQDIIVHTVRSIPSDALNYLGLSIKDYQRMIAYCADTVLINGEDPSQGSMFEHTLMQWMSAHIGIVTGWSVKETDVFNKLAQSILNEVRVMIDGVCYLYQGGIECVATDTGSLYLVGKPLDDDYY